MKLRRYSTSFRYHISQTLFCGLFVHLIILNLDKSTVWIERPEHSQNIVYRNKVNKAVCACEGERAVCVCLQCDLHCCKGWKGFMGEIPAISLWFEITFKLDFNARNHIVIDRNVFYLARIVRIRIENGGLPPKVQNHVKCTRLTYT